MFTVVLAISLSSLIVNKAASVGLLPYVRENLTNAGEPKPYKVFRPVGFTASLVLGAIYNFDWFDLPRVYFKNSTFKLLRKHFNLLLIIRAIFLGKLYSATRPTFRVQIIKIAHTIFKVKQFYLFCVTFL